MSGDQIHEWMTKEMRFSLDHLMCEYRRDDINLRVSQEALAQLSLEEAKDVVGEQVRQLEDMGL